jgi:hypothetical protein
VAISWEVDVLLGGDGQPFRFDRDVNVVCATCASWHAGALAARPKDLRRETVTCKGAKIVGDPATRRRWHKPGRSPIGLCWTASPLIGPPMPGASDAVRPPQVAAIDRAPTAALRGTIGSGRERPRAEPSHRVAAAATRTRPLSELLRPRQASGPRTRPLGSGNGRRTWGSPPICS